MDKFKMICLDIDGTLLNSKHKITSKTKEIIHYVSKIKNIPVILVSARMPKGILFLQKELEIIEPIICYSGSLILDKAQNVIHCNNIDFLSTEVLYNVIQKDKEIHMSLYKNDDWYIESHDCWSENESKITNITPTIVDFSNLFHCFRNSESGPNKILCMSKDENISKLNDKLKNKNYSCLNIYRSKPTYLEIMPNNCSKPNAINLLSKQLKIGQSEIIAFGDNFNDIDMLKFAGVGIAMGNAPEEVKAAANAVTASNDEDGIYYALKKLIV